MNDIFMLAIGYFVLYAPLALIGLVLGFFALARLAPLTEKLAHR